MADIQRSVFTNADVGGVHTESLFRQPLLRIPSQPRARSYSSTPYLEGWRGRLDEKLSRQLRLHLPFIPRSRSVPPKPCLKDSSIRRKGRKRGGGPVMFASTDEIREMTPVDRPSRNRNRKTGDYDYAIEGDRRSQEEKARRPNHHSHEFKDDRSDGRRGSVDHIDRDWELLSLRGRNGTWADDSRDKGKKWRSNEEHERQSGPPNDEFKHGRRGGKRRSVNSIMQPSEAPFSDGRSRTLVRNKYERSNDRFEEHARWLVEYRQDYSAEERTHCKRVDKGPRKGFDSDERNQDMKSVKADVRYESIQHRPDERLHIEVGSPERRLSNVSDHRPNPWGQSGEIRRQLRRSGLADEHAARRHFLDVAPSIRGDDSSLQRSQTRRRSRQYR